MAVTDFATSYAAIIKQEKQDDGTLLVYGKATDDALDIDNQICDAGWLNKAMPEWFKSGGNIREQHSNIAAGVAKELDTKADGHYISALVVDAQSVKKVEAGVLKGFSIGIRSPRIPAGFASRASRRPRGARARRLAPRVATTPPISSC